LNPKLRPIFWRIKELSLEKQTDLRTNRSRYIYNF